VHSILITGAASGIGLGLTRHFAALGHRVIACDLQPLEIGGSVRKLAFDVADAAQIERALASVADDPPDVLINNAGLQYVAPIEDYPPGKWQQLIAVMLTGAALMTRAALPAMRRQGFGRIVNIGSIHSLVATPYKSAYVAAKHGLVGFSKVIALETADTDITINTICPTYVKTPLVDKQIADQARTRGIPESQVVSEVMLKPMPKGVFITFEELAGITAFLMSPAARNITGHTIDVDGGWTVQ
jgi:3-hydroxybutyrate dehydrogenase